jgi:hypothetical protein
MQMQMPWLTLLLLLQCRNWWMLLLLQQLLYLQLLLGGARGAVCDLLVLLSTSSVWQVRCSW